jgi:redox-sensitive bicupin YhaK (pirin superfamily)
MDIRKVTRKVRGLHAVDGAGVHLVRVLGYATAADFDPFLMLDSFDSADPSKYMAGFPMHPHRGIETVTYLLSGRIDHEDSLGNKGSIGPGESQWMVAGSGILHQEMPQRAERLLGLQLWINLPSKDKMTTPEYRSITGGQIARTEVDGAKVGVISGSFNGAQGTTPKYVQAAIYDVELPKGAEITIPSNVDENVFVFLIEGDGIIHGEHIPSKTAVLFKEGQASGAARDAIQIAAPAETDLRFIYFSGKPLREEVSWGGPIVMNTREELDRAFAELDRGTFVKH